METNTVTGPPCRGSDLKRMDAHELSRFIKDEWEACNQIHGEARKAAMPHAIACGRALIALKRRLPHGHFEGWVESKCRMARSTARLYMRIANYAPEIQERLGEEAAADLTVREMRALISEPERAKRPIAAAKQRERLVRKQLCEQRDALAYIDLMFRHMDEDKFDREILPELERIVDLARARQIRRQATMFAEVESTPMTGTEQQQEEARD